jgi:excisionase family DNA binding protein
MPRHKRSAQHLTTVQVARLLGVNQKTLYRMLQDGRVEEPPRGPNNYRQWTPEIVQQISEGLQGRS